MNWIDVLWPMLCATSLTLGLIHLLTWLRQREHVEHGAFVILCVGVSSVAIFELLGMRAPTPAHYASLLRWVQLPLACVLIGTVLFVRARFKAGRTWLAITIVGARLLCVAVDFLGSADNLNFIRIQSLGHVELWGSGPLGYPIGTPNPWMILDMADFALLGVFLIDALVTVWRRGPDGDRRMAALICGSIFFFILGSAGGALAVVLGELRAPMMINPSFVAVLIVMSYDLGGALLRSAQLSRHLSRTQAALRASEQRMQLAASAAGVGLWAWDVGNGDVWLSEPGMELFGFDPAERVDAARLEQRIHPDDRDAAREALAEAMRNGSYSVEYRIVDADGRMRWINSRGHLDEAGDGGPRLLRGIVADMTERKVADERFRIVVEASQTAMFLVDARGEITLVNRRAEAMFGYPRSDLVGMSVDALVPSRSRASHAAERDAYAAHATARSMGLDRELFAQRKDGSEFPVEVGLSPIRSEGGQFVIASVSDISERKRAEQELAAQRDELAHLSRVVLLTELSGSIAHELNQPLTAILSNAQAAVRFLAHSPPNLAEVRESLTHIIDNDKRAGEVIRRLRAMLRKEPAEYRDLDINDVVLDVLRIIRSDLLHRDVGVALDLDADLPAIRGDRVQLQQVLLNLAMNGIDAMAHLRHGAEICVKSRRDAAGGVQVLVIDRGCGIAEADLENVFKPFVTNKSHGMGLGLAVCASIIEGHRGTIRAENNPGGGATVSFVLPAVVGTSAAESDDARMSENA